MYRVNVLPISIGRNRQEHIKQIYIIISYVIGLCTLFCSVFPPTADRGGGE